MSLVYPGWNLPEAGQKDSYCYFPLKMGAKNWDELVTLIIFRVYFTINTWFIYKYFVSIISLTIALSFLF